MTRIIWEFIKEKLIFPYVKVIILENPKTQIHSDCSRIICKRSAFDVGFRLNAYITTWDCRIVI